MAYDGTSLDTINSLKSENGSSWDAINPEHIQRMRMQNRFKTGLEILNIQLTSCEKTWQHMMLIVLNILNH